VPIHVQERLRKVRRVGHDLEQRLGRAPTDVEIGTAMGLSAAEVRFVLDAPREVRSLETPVRENGAMTELGALLTDPASEAPERAGETAVRRRALSELLARLTLREREVLARRYGLGGRRPETLDEIGRSYDLTRERIRQLENQALQRLAAMRDRDRLR
jgi:RNA polymerase primary sigma factor